MKSRAVKMSWNLRANPAHHGFGSGWVEIFLQISIRVDFWPGSSGLNPWWARLAHQPADKRVTSIFISFLLSWTLHLGHIKLFLIQHINNLYFFILVCIWIVLKFI